MQNRYVKENKMQIEELIKKFYPGVGNYWIHYLDLH
jgi:hypothetical protein